MKSRTGRHNSPEHWVSEKLVRSKGNRSQGSARVECHLRGPGLSSAGIMEPWMDFKHRIVAWFELCSGNIILTGIVEMG